MKLRTSRPDAAAPPTEVPDDLLAALLRAYGPAVQTDPPAWANYAAASSRWRFRVDSILMDMLATPSAYLRDRQAAWQRKHPGQNPRAWFLAFEEAFAAVREQIFDLRDIDQTAVDLANEICGGKGREPRATALIMELALAGWLPRPPTRPDLRTDPRRAARTDAQREADAEAAVDAWMGSPNAKE